MAQIITDPQLCKKALELSQSQEDNVCLLTSEEINSLPHLLPFSPEQMAHWKIHSSSFESHTGADCINLHYIYVKTPLHPGEHISLFLTEHNLILLFPNVSALHWAYAQFQEKDLSQASAERALYLFLSSLITNDPEVLQLLEQKITVLEEQLITSKLGNGISEIIDLRKQLMRLKNYYEQLLDICESLEENENDLIESSMLRYFHILTGRVERLLRTVEQLRDYVTQLREAYQSQVDINSNNIMRIFTVLTAIFLPLSLIAGWYGMNLKMPEYNWEFGYPLIVLISILVVGLCIFLFKRKKWF